MKFASQSLIDGETLIMGLIGEKIGYSVSPLMHNRAAKLLGKNIAYLPFPMGSSYLAPFLEITWHLGAFGFNVTQPHKAAVAALVDNSRRQSINTLYRGPNGWAGVSTDGQGFDRAVQRLGKSIGAFEQVVFLGAGGAVLSILEHFAAMAKEGGKIPPKVAVLRRSNTWDQALTDAIAGTAKLAIFDFLPSNLSSHLVGHGEDTLLVQATSAPLHGDYLSDYLVALDSFQGCLVDLVYGRPSDLYFRALAKGLLVQDGEPMLIEQARLSQEIWWGRSASYQDMADAIRRK
jgi:shikimate dehydrogenase